MRQTLPHRAPWRRPGAVSGSFGSSEDQVVLVPARADVQPAGERRGAAAGAAEQDQRAGAAARHQVRLAVAADVADAGEGVVLLPAGADLGPGAERCGGAAGALVEPELAGGVPGHEVGLAVP